MKKILIALAGIALAALLGFYFYYHARHKQALTPLFELVPPDAVIVYENRKPSYPPKSESDLGTWLRKGLKQDSIFISPALSKDIIASVHITGKEDFGIIYYHRDSAFIQTPAFRNLIKSGAIKKRSFEGYTIVELPSSTYGSISYTNTGDAIAFSRQSLLIEDVIRSLKEESTTFRTKNHQLFKLMQSDAGQGKLYANINSLAKFANIFLSDEVKKIIFRNPVTSLITDVKINKQTLLFNGFAIDSAAGQSSLLSILADQRPVASEIQKTVSNRTIVFTHYGIPDYKQWNKDRLAWAAPQYPEVIHAYNASEKDIKTADLYKHLSSEIGYGSLTGAKDPDGLLILKLKSKSESAVIKLLSGDEQPIDNYSNASIYQVKAPAFLYSAFWPINENKNLNYYTIHEPYIFFAENTEVLKSMINDIDEDNTWGKSSEWNTFFNSASLESNFSVEFNGSLLLPWLMNQIAPRWDSVSAPKAWGKIDKGAFQFSQLNHSYYFNGVLQFSSKKASVRNNAPVTIPKISFPEPIHYASIVKNHNNSASEILVQTSDGKLTLVSSDFKILFTADVKDKISGKLQQIDYYRNRKLQYVFIAGKSIYLIDRLGNTVKGFPKELNTSVPPEFLSIIDFDNTHNYRFLVSDQKGGMIMIDKEGKLIDDWDKQSLKAKAFGEPQAVRSDGKEYIVAVDVIGTVYAYNMKGAIAKGFPVTSGIRPQGSWFFERTAGHEGLITLVSGDGVKIQINLKGKIINKENYVRSASDSKFALISSPAGDDYAISRIDKSRVAILNRQGEVLFEKENPGSDTMTPSYHVPSSGEHVFAFRDTQQEFIYLFDEKGKPVLSNPLESSRAPMVVRKPKDGLLIFNVLNSDLKKVTP